MRLIDGDALGDELYAMYVHASPMHKAWITEIKKMVDKAPTAKFKLNTVVHARWEYLYCDSVCSACGHINRADRLTRLRDDTKYCPNCGARMDGDAHG